jgi:hypothetical protein
MMGTSQMGPSITAWICLLAGQFRMSVRNIQALLKRWWHIGIEQPGRKVAGSQPGHSGYPAL